MNDLISEKKFSRPSEGNRSVPKSRTGATGPRSREGKARSSMNRLSHGLCSEKIILPEEDPAEFEAFRDCWLEAYATEHTVEIVFLQETVEAHWLLKRAQKRFRQFEMRLPPDACERTSEHHQQFNNFTRYKAAAGRAFIRYYRELEHFQGRLLNDARAREKALCKAAALEIKWLDYQEQQLQDDFKVAQFVDVDIIGGECVTTCCPSNESVIRQVAAREKPVLMISRYLSFPNGIPEQYNWLRPNIVQQKTGSLGVQKMPYEHWLKLIEYEKSVATGHIGPFRELP